MKMSPLSWGLRFEGPSSEDRVLEKISFVLSAVIYAWISV